jgi:hypothetical protein
MPYRSKSQLPWKSVLKGSFENENRQKSVIIMTIIEEAIVGLFHHQSIAASLGELVGPRLQETIAGFLIMLLVLIPYFAFRILDEALGKGRLAGMFFVQRESLPSGKLN